MPRLFDGDPTVVGRVRFEDGFDKFHCAHAFGCGREVALIACADGLDEFIVDVGEGLDEAFGVSGGDTRGADGRGRFVAHIGCVALVGFFGLARIFDVKDVGLFLVPVESGLFAIDAEAHAIFFAGRDFGNDDGGFGAAFEMHEDGGVVVEIMAGREGRKVGEDGRGFEARHVFNQGEGVDADVGDDATFAGDFWVHLPFVTSGERLGEIAFTEGALGIFEDDFGDRAEFIFEDEVARGLDHWVARVGEGDAEDALFAFGEACEFVGFGECEGEWFFAHDVEASEKGGACNFVVRIVGCANDEEVNFAALGRDEVLPVWVAACGVEAEGFGGFGVCFGAAREATGDEVGEVIHADGHAMDGADKTAAGAADHGVGEAAVGRLGKGLGRFHNWDDV